MVVLTPIHLIQYGTPVFITSKKEWTVRFITEYCRLNHPFSGRSYPLPIMFETMQQLEGFQYATA